MANLDEFYAELTSSDKDKEAKKVLTLRLPLTVHRKLEVIRDVGNITKTAAAEEIAINAIEDVYQRLLNDPRLEDYWQERSLQEQYEEEQAIEQSIAAQSHAYAGTLVETAQEVVF